MALVKEFFRIHLKRYRVHREVACGYSLFVRNGVTYLQLDTYGSAERKLRGKTSQSLQFDEDAARQLTDLFDCVFPRGEGGR
jgi:hypothetical protein